MRFREYLLFGCCRAKRITKNSKKFILASNREDMNSIFVLNIFLLLMEFRCWSCFLFLPSLTLCVAPLLWRISIQQIYLFKDIDWDVNLNELVVIQSQWRKKKRSQLTRTFSRMTPKARPKIIRTPKVEKWKSRKKSECVTRAKQSKGKYHGWCCLLQLKAT